MKSNEKVFESEQQAGTWSSTMEVRTALSQIDQPRDMKTFISMDPNLRGAAVEAALRHQVPMQHCMVLSYDRPDQWTSKPPG